MALEEHVDAQAAATAAREAIPTLLASSDESVLRSLLHNPAFDETHVCLLLERKDISGLLLEEISKRKIWRAAYRVRLGLAAHPHTPRLIAMRLLRELHLMDLVRISLLTTSSMELRRLAEERILTQFAQLPLGQKIMLARRGSTRIAASLVLHGPEQVARVALNNSFLTESQLLKTLAKQTLPARIVAAVASHDKWSRLINVRVALLRHPGISPDQVSALLPGLPRRDIEDLLGLSRLKENVRAHLQEELAHRKEMGDLL
ncbi:MAG TPA: hypothetical protein VK709_08800 [Candidatus Saccharimonadales bacterium]|jgi:hypothetical protein|nr:hypothetical protein [Candidatus Saccharimonadales bacterium]